MVVQGQSSPNAGPGEDEEDLGLALPSSSHHRAWMRLSSPDHSKGDTDKPLHLLGLYSVIAPLSTDPARARPPPPPLVGSGS